MAAKNNLEIAFYFVCVGGGKENLNKALSHLAMQPHLS